MSKINQVSPTPLALPTSHHEGTQQGPDAQSLNTGSTTAPNQPTPENLISQTESVRQTTNSSEAGKLLSPKGATPATSTQTAGPLPPNDPIDEAALTTATPFEEIPASQMTHEEARTELLSLQDQGNIKVEFTDEGKTRLFVPMFDVNFKKETNDAEKSKVRSFLFPKPQSAVKLSRLSEWASLKGIKEILFRKFTKPKEADKPAEAPPAVENKAPVSAPETKPLEPKEVTQAQPPAEALKTDAPPPHQPVQKPLEPKKEKPKTIPLSRLRTGGAIPLSSSATPIQKPTAVQTPTKPLTSRMSPMQLALSQTKAKRDLNIATPSDTTKAGTPKAESQSQTTTPSPTASEAPKSTSSTPSPTSEKPSTPLSSLGSRLESLLRKKPMANPTKYSLLSTRTSSLLRKRPKTSLWNMDIAGYKGQDPKTGQVLEAHGNRDMIRFNHHSFIQSIRSNRAEVAREANKKAAAEKEQQAQAQRAEEQQQLRMLLEMEQMRQIDSNLLDEQARANRRGPLETAPAPHADPTRPHGVEPLAFDAAQAQWQHPSSEETKKN